MKQTGRASETDSVATDQSTRSISPSIVSFDNSLTHKLTTANRSLNLVSGAVCENLASTMFHDQITMFHWPLAWFYAVWQAFHFGEGHNEIDPQHKKKATSSSGNSHQLTRCCWILWWMNDVDQRRDDVLKSKSRRSSVNVFKNYECFASITISTQVSNSKVIPRQAEADAKRLHKIWPTSISLLKSIA